MPMGTGSPGSKSGTGRGKGGTVHSSGGRGRMVAEGGVACVPIKTQLKKREDEFKGVKSHRKEGKGDL